MVKNSFFRLVAFGAEDPFGYFSRQGRQGHAKSEWKGDWKDKNIDKITFHKVHYF